MDPDAALARVRDLVRAVSEGDLSSGYDLAEQVEVLDEWISTGGYLPKAWTYQR